MEKKQDMTRIWHDDKGNVVACAEKIKVMEEDIVELKQMLQDIFEDGILMDISELELRECLLQLVHNLINPYKGKNV